MKAVTHDGPFHADDVFAGALLKLVYSELTIIRSRDEDVAEGADIIFDVGMVYDEDVKRFDHHQTGGAGERENGIPYSSFGLLWKHFGDKLCDDVVSHKRFDQLLVQPIDALDNGVELVSQLSEELPFPFMVQDVIKYMRPTWNDKKNFDDAYEEARMFATKVIQDVLRHIKSREEARSIIRNIYQDSADKRIIELPAYMPWEDVLCEYSEPLFVVYPSINGLHWNAEVVRDNPNSFSTQRIYFVEEWAGLREEELEKVSGVKGAVFVHRSKFIAVAKTKEGVLELVRKTLNSSKN